MGEGSTAPPLTPRGPMAKPRRKSDGSVEIGFPCPLCGARKFKLEVNSASGLWHCWVCNRGGRLSGEELQRLQVTQALVVQGDSKHEPTPPPIILTEAYPPYVQQRIRLRGFDPAWLQRRYKVQWDGSRLCWPCGQGWSRRAIWPWEEPKTLTVAPKGLIGQHLLSPGARVVLVEGDYKAASIPLPWIGIGLMGTGMTPEQLSILAASEPKEVLIMLDGGFGEEAKKLAEFACLLSPRVVDCLPEGQGPDDVPRRMLYQILMA